MTDSKTPIRIGTRASQLARWQAEHVAGRLRALGVEATFVYIETTGDRDRVRDFGSLGAKGVFVKEIETALIEERIDLAVHSLKDLPTLLPQGLTLGAVLERDSPFDALISAGNLHFADLPAGATVATGSLRRAAQVLALRPDLKTAPLRGNVPTRIRKIREGRADATLLAEAGLRRLGLEHEAADRFDADQVTPAMGQGAVAIEARDGELTDLLTQLEHRPSRIAADAERRFIAKVGGGCRTPVGVLAARDGEGWTLTAALASPEGRSLVREKREAVAEDALNAAADELGQTLLERADASILATLERGPDAPARGE